MKKVVVDTNIFIRFFLSDIPSQVKEIDDLFLQAKKGKIEIIVLATVIFEIEFTLRKYYEFPKETIAEKITLILSQTYFSVEHMQVLRIALEIYLSNNLSFVDCFLSAYVTVGSIELFTFDKKLKKISQH